jgi:uncharacterized repeat protein (TIGR02543 family)
VIAAIPAPGYHFSSWEQAGGDFDNAQNPRVCEPCNSPQQNPLSITLLSDRVIEATFELDAFSVNVVANGGGDVAESYMPEPGPDSTVVFNAIPEPGYVFTGWEGAVTGTENPVTVKLTGPVEVHANFVSTTVAAAPPKAPVVPAVLALAPVSPNPAVGHARFSYSLPRDERVRIDVLDIQGRQVGEIADGVRSAGRHDAEWAGPATPGAPKSGVYFVRLKTEDGVLTRRFVLTP